MASGLRLLGPPHEATQFLERQSFWSDRPVALIDLHPVPADLGAAWQWKGLRPRP